MYRALRPLLFSLNPELSHDVTIALLAMVGKYRFAQDNNA